MSGKRTDLKPFVWTDDNFEIAKSEYLSGNSAQTIVSIIGCKTRSQVIGKMRRMGVKKRQEPSSTKYIEQKKDRPSTPKIRNIPPPIVHKDVPALGLNIMQLLPFHAEITSCRWPIGGTGFEMKFCGLTTRARPYCKLCSVKAYRPTTAKQKASGMRGAL